MGDLKLKFMKNIITFNVKEISERNKENRKIEIPTFQRGLVWKPQQIELLWDSILRGFPIGTFTLSETDTSNNKGENSLYLMDGQQRFYSIGLGLDDSVWRKNNDKKTDPNTVLWLDLGDNSDKKSSRKFWIRATTKYHPWGYENNDECSVLSAKERREAMLKYGFEEGTNIYKDDSISLTQTWPYKAKLPIPIYVFFKPFMNAENHCATFEEFATSVIQEIKNKKSDEEDKWRTEFLENLNLDEVSDKIRDLYDTFKEASKYSVAGTLLDEKVIENETEKNVENNEVSTSLEVLFNRLGSGGTRITDAELRYSAITAYWGEIKDKNEALAKEYMPPTNLVLLAFRFILTENEKLAGNPSVQRIRNLKNDDNFRNKIVNFYNNKELEIILEKVSIMLDGEDPNPTPTILKLDVYKNHPDLMLLLMYIADKVKNMDNRFIRAVVFYIIWFSKKENEIVQTIFSKISSTKFENIEKNIKIALFECLYKDLVIPIPLIDNIFDDNTTSTETKKVYNLLKNNENVLLFAQREFINKTFPYYKPVSSSDWPNHNRPWDFDHIVPRDWFIKRGVKPGPFRKYSDEYIEIIANRAAIPFEINRSKNNSNNWDYYKNYEKQLYFNIAEIEDINCKITHCKEMSNNFITFCKKRMNLIYHNCNDAIFKQVNLYKETSLENLSKKSSRRKEIFENLKEMNEFKDYKLYYLDGDTNEEFEIGESNLVDWARSWISLGHIDNDLMLSLSSNGDVYAIGLRKKPDAPSTQDNVYNKNKEVINQLDTKGTFSRNEWWYYGKVVEDNVEDGVENNFIKFIEEYKSNKKG